MKEIKGTLTEYRWTASPNPRYPHRLATFEVDNELHRKLKAHHGIVRAFDELSGESTFYVHGKEIIGIKNGGRLYKRERVSSSLGKGLILLGIFLVIWPYFGFTMSDDPDAWGGFGLFYFTLLTSFVSVPGGLFSISLGAEYYGRGKRLDKLEAIAEKENLKVVEL